MESLTIIRENIFILMSKNGRIKHHGGAHQYKVMHKLTPKKLTLNLLSFQISKVKPDQQFKK
jgi:hypothetical protein